MHFLDILVVFRLDIGQISFNPGEEAFATQQLALLATRIAFYDVLAQAFFFLLSFFSFFSLFAAVIDLLLDLLSVKKLLRERHRDGQFLPWSSQVQWQEILL